MDEIPPLNIIPEPISEISCAPICAPSCGMNRNVYSSFLFILPILYTYDIFPFSYLFLGSIACLITSVMNHYYKAQHKLLSFIDRIVVNSIAFYFTLHCFRKIGNKFYANIVYILAALSLSCYYYIAYHKPELYSSYQWVVHILSISGVLFYAKSIKLYLVPYANVDASADANADASADAPLSQIT